jgi:hypothetical protein
LIEKAIKNSALYGPYDFVFGLGDFPGHRLVKKMPGYNDRNLSNDASKYVTSLLHETYPNTMILSVLGNNEGDDNYNFSTIKNSYRLKELYYDCGYNNVVNNNTQFLEYGYYTQETSFNLTIIALNSVFYSPRSTQTGN